MRQTWRRRLSFRVAAAAAALTLFFVLAVGLGAYWVMSALIHQQAELSLQGEADLRAEKMTDLLEGISGNFRALAANTVVTNALGDSSGREIYLAPLLADFSEVNGIKVSAVVTDFRGVPLSLKPGEAQPAGGGDGWVAEVVASGRGRARIVSRPDGVLAVMVAVPVIYVNTGTPEGALVYTLPLPDIARRTATNRSGLATSRVVLETVGERWSVEQGAAGGEAAAGGAGLDAKAPVRPPQELAGFRVSVELEGHPSVLDLPLRRLTDFFLSIGLVTVLVVLVGSALMARRLTRSLSRLAEAASAYAFGRGDRNAFLVGGDDEIADLGAAFAAMTERLDLAFRDLERRSQTLLANAERVAHLGSASWNLANGQHLWSDEFHAILGLEPGDCQPGRETLSMRIHPGDRERLERALDAAVGGGGRITEDFRLVQPDGQERVVHLTAVTTLDPDGRPLRLDATLQDITERGRLQRQLDDLVVELRRSNGELEQFAYVASHDLRQPLRVVGSYVSLLEAELDGHLTGDAREFMAFIRDGVKRMDALIVDLLAYSRVGRTSASEPVDAAAAIEDALADLSVALAEAQAQVTVQPDLPTVVADRSELVRLFQNLLGNAVKYRSADRPPRVEVGCQDWGLEWRFFVRDNGIGIPAEHCDRIFGIFQRLHARHEYEGTGVGLAICKKVVESSGGRIWLDSIPGEGSTFWFGWPKARQAALAVP